MPTSLLICRHQIFGMKQPCTIGLIGGTGTEGRGIALRLAAAGLELGVGSRLPVRARELASELNEQLKAGRISGTDNATLISQSEIVFLTVPFVHADAVLQEHRERFFAGQILVDVTVPVVFDKGPRLLELAEGSGAEHIRNRIPLHLALVAAFKTLPAHLLAHADSWLDCDEFICSDSVEAKRRVLDLVSRIPRLRWVDAGSLSASRSLEAMTLLAIDINRRHKVQASRFRLVGLP
ncbi:MAG: NADPH-dependent F420 reductase [Acidobacteria bacterium]|nr:NADPH-dependent F420 reductase [Acidobacteriota bacterium]